MKILYNKIANVQEIRRHTMKKLIMILIAMILVMILLIAGYGYIIYRKTIQDKPIAEIEKI